MRCALALALFTAAAIAQIFDAATIKPSPPLDFSQPISMGPKGGPGTPDPGRYSCNYCEIADLISQAYDVPEYRIFAARLFDDRYHVVATVPAGATREQFRAMLRNLLAERFGFVAHTEAREMPIYRLVVSGTLKLTPHVDGAPPPRDDPSKPRLPGISYRQQGKRVADFARVLQNQLRTPVEDATGLSALYDFDVEWALRDDSDSSLPDLFGALRSIGLKLESRKGKLDCVIVDRVEKLRAQP